jgi:hypothetical protein
MAKTKKATATATRRTTKVVKTRTQSSVENGIKILKMAIN